MQRRVPFEHRPAAAALALAYSFDFGNAGGSRLGEGANGFAGYRTKG